MGLLEHRLVDLNNRKLFSGGWGGQKSEDSGKALVHGLFQLVVAPGVLGLWPYHAMLISAGGHVTSSVSLKGPFASFTRALVVTFRGCSSNPG